MLTCRIFRVDVKIDFMFVALVTIFLLTDRTGISVIALLGCLIHELGHLIVFFAVGYTPRAMVFELMGIRLVKPEQELSPGKDALVQCGGCLANFLCFFLFAGTMGDISFQSVFAATHFLLGFFHLLPLKSLDGGKLLSLLCLRFFTEHTSEMVCTIFDFASTLGLLLLTVSLTVSGSRSMALAVMAGGLFMSLLEKAVKQKNREA